MLETSQEEKVSKQIDVFGWMNMSKMKVKDHELKYFKFRISEPISIHSSNYDMKSPAKAEKSGKSGVKSGSVSEQ